MQQLARQYRTGLTLNAVGATAVLAPARPTVACSALRRRIRKGAPNRHLLFCAGNQTLRIRQIQIRIGQRFTGILRRAITRLAIFEHRLQPIGEAIKLLPLCEQPRGMLDQLSGNTAMGKTVLAQLFISIGHD